MEYCGILPRSGNQEISTLTLLGNMHIICFECGGWLVGGIPNDFHTVRLLYRTFLKSAVCSEASTEYYELHFCTEKVH